MAWLVWSQVSWCQIFSVINCKQVVFIASQQIEKVTNIFTLYPIGTLEVILDRRLSQDDNRGLGQGVQDNKRTPANFRLFVEKLQTKEDQASAGVPLTYHSLASNTISQHLSHPISVLHHSHTDTSTLRPEFAGLTRALPCDMFIVNLRTIQKGLEPEPTEQAALLLRRHGYDCSFPSWCRTTMGKVGVAINVTNTTIRTKY